MPYLLGVVKEALKPEKNATRSLTETVIFICLDWICVCTFCIRGNGGYHGLEFDIAQLLRLVIYSLILAIEGGTHLIKRWHRQLKARRRE
jgi:hypothetical protein